MSDSPFLPECGTCRFARAVLMFVIGYICFNLTMSDYTTGSMMLSTESKALNEAILTCIVVTGAFCIGYGTVLLGSLIKPKADEYEHEAEPVETP
jgi:hypothetical protein